MAGLNIVERMEKLERKQQIMELEKAENPPQVNLMASKRDLQGTLSSSSQWSTVYTGTMSAKELLRQTSALKLFIQDGECKEFVCHECGIACPSKASLANHLEHKCKNVCDVCKDIFANQTEVRIHMMKDHKERMANIDGRVFFFLFCWIVRANKNNPGYRCYCLVGRLCGSSGTRPGRSLL